MLRDGSGSRRSNTHTHVYVHNRSADIPLTLPSAVGDDFLRVPSRSACRSEWDPQLARLFRDSSVDWMFESRCARFRDRGTFSTKIAYRCGILSRARHEDPLSVVAGQYIPKTSAAHSPQKENHKNRKNKQNHDGRNWKPENRYNRACTHA